MQLAFNLNPTPTPLPRSAPTVGKHERELVRDGVRIVFTLQRSRRRSIGLTVTETGLKVVAPSWVSLQQIDAAVLEKFDWIVKKLHAAQARIQRQQQAESNWRSGGVLPYMGRRIELQCGNATDPAAHGQIWFEGDADAPSDGQQLWLPLPPDSDVDQVRDITQGWLQRQAKVQFGKRLTHFEVATGLKPARWKLSSATSRWGSCTCDGNIALHWRLIHFGLPVIDYVIAHELAHLKELNHSPAFWETVKSIYPPYLEGYQALKGLSPTDTPTV
jgi:predicted metal-dependent hydrolase